METLPWSWGRPGALWLLAAWLAGASPLGQQPEALSGRELALQEPPSTGDGEGPVLEPEAASEVQPAAAEEGSAETDARPPTYSFLESRETLLSAWETSGIVKPLELGTSSGGRELFAVQFGKAGPEPLVSRATIFLIGGLDGVSLAGSQAVISVVDALLAAPDRLPDDATFIAIPWANPDGLARWRSLGCGGGRNDRSIDDDGDERVDEDGPDDLDRDGLVLEMLIEDPNGPWARAVDGRLLRPARDGEAPRYLRMREGRDDDGDGQFNEDGPGGVVLDHNFPVGWVGSWKGVDAGPWPLSEPDALALAELALARRTAVVLVFQGNHGGLASPGGMLVRDGQLALPLAEDGPTYKALVQLFTKLTGRDQEQPLHLFEARGEAWPGSAVDWFYGALGALAMEVGVWGPDVQDDGRETVAAQFLKEGLAGRPEADLEIPPAELAWARWLDETRGGIGFVDWQPVDLGVPRAAWVGGWEPHTCFNPPADLLPEVTQGLGGFVLEISKNLPRLEIELREAKREGRVCLLRARVRNGGSLASGVGPGAENRGARLRLELPQGVALLAGELEVSLGHLPGRGTSPEYVWLLTAPEGSVFRISAESAWSPPSVREVRL
jgi:hypothetical protein